LFKYGDFKQLQFVQKTKKEYHVNLNTSEKVDENAIAIEFKNYLGDDAVIKVNYVDEIPLLSSGKRRQIVNEYYKD
jgi:phenylacetate-CoA ligase